MAKGNRNPIKRNGIPSNKGQGNNPEREIRAAMFAEPVVKALLEDLESTAAIDGPLTTGPNSSLKQKDASIVVRVPEELKLMFAKVCSGQGVNDASVVRALIHYYVKNYGATRFSCAK